MSTHLLAFEDAAGFGGAYLDLHHIALCLRARGVEVTIARSHHGPYFEPLAAAGVTLLPPHRRGDVAGELWRRGVPSPVRRVAYAAELGFGLGIRGARYALWARRHGVTHVFANNGLMLSTAAITVAKALGVPLYSYIQGSPQGNRIFPVLYRAAARAFCVSAMVQRQAIGHGLPAELTEVLYPGVESPKTLTPRPPDGRVRVGMVGMLMPWKGQLQFLEAFARVARDAPAADALLFGRPPSPQQNAYRQQILERIEALGLRGRATLVEDRSRPEDIYPELDVAVHASTDPEPFGRVVIEAMSYGLPVIAAPGGPSEVVRPDLDGYVIAPTDTAALAEQLKRLCVDAGLRQRLAANARQRAQDFAYPAVLSPLFHAMGLR